MPWPKNMKLIDANVILRYLLNDHPETSLQAKEIIASGAYTKPEVIAEVVYVLKGVYQVTRNDTRRFIGELLRCVSCTEVLAVKAALELYADTSLDFVDCLLTAYHQVNGEEVFTFDRKLIRYLEK